MSLTPLSSNKALSSDVKFYYDQLASIQNELAPQTKRKNFADRIKIIEETIVQFFHRDYAGKLFSVQTKDEMLLKKTMEITDNLKKNKNLASAETTDSLENIVIVLRKRFLFSATENNKARPYINQLVRDVDYIKGNHYVR